MFIHEVNHPAIGVPPWPWKPPELALYHSTLGVFEMAKLVLKLRGQWFCLCAMMLFDIIQVDRQTYDGGATFHTYIVTCMYVCTYIYIYN